MINKNTARANQSHFQFEPPSLVEENNLFTGLVDEPEEFLSVLFVLGDVCSLFVEVFVESDDVELESPRDVLPEELLPVLDEGLLEPDGVWGVVG